MGKRSPHKPAYPFAWLDEAVEITLNPENAYAGLLQPEALEHLKEQFSLEMRAVFTRLKTETFELLSEKKLKVTVQKYHHALFLLMQRATANQEKYAEEGLLKTTGDIVIQHLSELLAAIENRYPGCIPATENGKFPVITPPDPALLKISCALSVDQIGIILKAADDVRLILSRSLSLVFKTIAPYLSTPHKKELSWDSMRSNSYHPEARDREIAIETLEKMIRQIRDYR